MAGKKLEYDITVDSSGSIAGLNRFASAASSAMRKAEGEFDSTASAAQKVATVIGRMADETTAELKATAQAADRLGAALGPELAGRLGAGGLRNTVADLRAAGLSFEAIEADAESLAVALRKVDDVKLESVRQGFADTDAALGRTRDSADQTRSVMANLAGNAAQDLGVLGGAAGTAGVAIGQLAEYAVDGNIKLKNLAQLAVPMLGVAAAATIVSKSLSDIREKAQFRTDQVDRFADGLRDGATAAELLAGELDAIGDIKFETGLGVTIELRDALAQLSMDVGDFTKLTNLSADQVTVWAERQKAAGADVDALGQVVLGAAYARQQLATADERAAITAEVLGDATADTAEATEEASDFAERYREKLTELAAAERDAADAAAERAGALQTFADIILDATDAQRGLAEAATAANETAAAGGDNLAELAGQLDDVKRAAREYGDTQVAAYEATQTAFGGVATNAGRLDTLNRALLEQASTLEGPARDAVLSYVADLNTIPPEKMTEVVALLAAGDLEGAVAALDEASATRTATIEADAAEAEARAAEERLDAAADPRVATLDAVAETNAAQNALNAAALPNGQPRSAPVVGKPDASSVNSTFGSLSYKVPVVGAYTRTDNVPSSINIPIIGTLYKMDAGGVAPRGGALAGEGDGPELIEHGGRAALTAGPTFVPAGTRVTSTADTRRLIVAGGRASRDGPTNITVKVEAAVIGNRFEVERAVRRATRDGIRLAGTR